MMWALLTIPLMFALIFMAAAPLIQPISVTFPQTEAETHPNAMNGVLVVTVDKAGKRYLSDGMSKNQWVDNTNLIERVRTALKHNPGMTVKVRGDKETSYSQLVELIMQLQKGGVPNVGLITESPGT
jgi:biopolymer transport protein TolR